MCVCVYVCMEGGDQELVFARVRCLSRGIGFGVDPGSVLFPCDVCTNRHRTLGDDFWIPLFK